LRQEGQQRVVVVAGLPFHHYRVGDRLAEAYAMVTLVEQGYARQVEVAGAFGCDVRTVRRYQQRFGESGLSGLGRPSGYPGGRRRVAASRDETVNRWKAEGVPNREIARRLGIDEKAVRKALRRLGWGASAQGGVGMRALVSSQVLVSGSNSWT
jgi:DNA invertase Pin-like site-specific DNA recombinase